MTIFRKEALMMATIQGDAGVSHPNLVQMLHCSWDGELLIVLEYFPWGSLKDVFESQNGSDEDDVGEAFQWSHDDSLKGKAYLFANNRDFP